MILTIVLAFQEVSYEKELQPVAHFLGRFEGKGEHPWGPYDHTSVGEWSLNKTVLAQCSRSTMGEQTVFEEVRMFSYDASTKKIRVRQYARGMLKEYDVEVRDEGKTLVFHQTRHEGPPDPEWRYTYRSTGEDEYFYQVDAKEKGEFRLYVKGTMNRKK